MSTPSLSVIIPTYNRSGFVRECLISLRDSGVPDLEIIVTDDGSTDDTAEVVKATNPNAIYLWHPNTGTPTTPKNRGFAVSRGRYVGFLDCDDQWIAGAPARAVELLDRYSDVGLVYGDTLMGNPESGWRSLMAGRDQAEFETIPNREPEPGFRILDPGVFYERLAVRNQFAVCSGIMRRELFDAAGGFDPTMKMAEDWDLWLRLCCRTTVGWMDRPIARYFLHAGGMSWQNSEGFQLGFCRALRNALDKAAVSPAQRRLLRRQLSRQLYGYGYSAFNEGRLQEARGRLREAMQAGDRRPQTYALWLACHLPPGLLDRLRRWRRTRTQGTQ